VVDSRCGDSRRGFAVFEVEWDDAEAMAASLSSPEGQAFATDTGPYVTEETIFLNYPVQDALSS
jgi:quinol monooxygenase YgiN